MLRIKVKLTSLSIFFLWLLWGLAIVSAQQQFSIDIWTDKGGMGADKSCGTYKSGETIIIHFNVSRKALIRLSLLLPDGLYISDVIVPIWVNAGSHNLEWTLGLPEGRNTFILEAEDEQGNRAKDECYVDIKQPFTVTVTMMVTQTITEIRTTIEFVTNYYTVVPSARTVTIIIDITKTTTVYTTITVAQTLASIVTPSIAAIGAVHALRRFRKRRSR